MHLGGEALEMLLDEEEAQELVVGERDRDEPGCGDREKQRASGENLHFSKQCPVALDQDIESERRQRQHDADQSLAQHGEGARRPGEEHVPEREREHGAAQEERQPHVQGIDLPEHDVERATGEHRGGVDPRGRAEKTPSCKKHHENSRKAGERSPQPCRPVRDFEQREERGGGPVLQRRLLEVLEAVQARRDPVAARHHLARDLGVAALVGVVERPHAEIPREMVAGGGGKRWRGPVPSRTISTPRFLSKEKSSSRRVEKLLASQGRTRSDRTTTLESWRWPFTSTWSSP